jgi:Ca2+-binding RTX toxin-like protein
LTGGGGADVFAFGNAASTATARDVITDFAGGTDKISFGLGATNSGTGPAGFSAGADAASYAAAQAAAAAVISAGTDDVVAIKDTGATLTYVFADTDSDNAIDTVIEISGLVTLAQTDFVG